MIFALVAAAKPCQDEAAKDKGPTAEKFLLG
jgi:hypothetical protein